MSALQVVPRRHQSRLGRRALNFFGGVLAVALTAGVSLAALPAAASASPENQTGSVAEATLDWGVKESFRKYITSPVANGSARLLGNVAQSETGTYLWSAGAGEATTDGSSANVDFPDDSGIHFQGHNMQIDGRDVPLLDVRFTNARVVVTSPTTGEIRMDVEGNTFVNTTELGEAFTLTDQPIAALALPEPAVEGDTLSWRSAEATLTEQGSVAFGGGAFYQPGESLDAVSFSLPIVAELGGETEPDPAPEPGPGGGTPGSESPGNNESPEAIDTSTVIAKESTSSATAGREVALTAVVTPEEAEGSVQFYAGEAKLESAIPTAEGSATLRMTKLPVGTHAITARFIPLDDKKFVGSESNPHELRIRPAPGGSSAVTNATLDWGVKTSFRNYIYNFAMFEGRAKLSGTTAQPTPKGTYVWTAGKGTAANDATRADVSFGKGNGVHFQSHPMQVGGKSVFALDLKFTNPRVEITSESKGKLHMDVDGYTFEGMTVVGKPFTLRDAPIADLTLGIPEVNAENTLLSWKGVQALLTKEGEVAFGGFYQVGEELDPMDVSLPGDFSVTAKTSTSVKLSASPVSTTVGKNVTFTAIVEPGIDGAVTFSRGNTTIGAPVPVKNGVAKLATTKLPEGVYSAHALFEPEDTGEYYHSNSNSVQLTIDSATKPKQPTPAKPSGGQGAGSLSWGISSQFAGYTTAKSNTAACPTAGKHCAGGDISTSGVGAGYLFPQSGSQWDQKSHTGTVNFAGTVAFNGYGTTMYRVANPSITVTSATSATLSTGYSGPYGPGSVQLDLGSASKSVGAGGEVTWTNVPVVGSLMGISAGQSIAFDSLSFTVGAASKVAYGSTVEGKDAKEKRVAAPTPPATEGLTIVTDKEKLVPGGRIEIQAAGFDPEDEGVLVVLYSEPIVLDDEATADEFGIVRWTGKLPDTIEPGEHVLTLQGSTNVGAKIKILPKEEKKKKAVLAAVDSKSEPKASALGSSAPTSISGTGMALWEWWTIAISLVMIAGCTTVLAARQRASGRA